MIRLAQLALQRFPKAGVAKLVEKVGEIPGVQAVVSRDDEWNRET